MSMVGGYARFVAVVRLALLYGGLFLAVISAIDWAVRTRRISPFNRVARFFRSNVDPLLAPIERVVVRAGGMPSSAAWWALVAYAVFGILILSLLRLVGDLLFQAAVMVNQPSEAWRILLSWAISLLILALFVRVLASWLPVSPYSRWIRWAYVLTDWMIRPLQRIVPRVGMFDITPIIAWLLLSLLRNAILSLV
jgi:YggT family protein